MTQDVQSLRREKMTITGIFPAEQFPAWIHRYATKLGVSGTTTFASENCIELHLSGPAELIDMMEVGCSLGPFDVWVESIRRERLG